MVVMAFVADPEALALDLLLAPMVPVDQMGIDALQVSRLLMAARYRRSLINA